MLSSHISCIYTIITFMKKRFEAAESGSLTAPIAGNRNQDPNADTAGLVTGSLCNSGINTQAYSWQGVRNIEEAEAGKGHI